MHRRTLTALALIGATALPLLGTSSAWASPAPAKKVVQPASTPAGTTWASTPDGTTWA